MTRTQIVALVLGALAVFWMVGAHNRLVALRNGIGAAWAKVDEALRARAAAAQALLQVLREHLQAEQGALDAWQASLAEAATAAATMGQRPVIQAHALAWTTAESALAATASRVFALMDLHAALRDDPAAREPAAAWHEASTRLAFARQVFNEAAAPYNEAISIFPTRLLVPLFRFEAAGRL